MTIRVFVGAAANGEDAESLAVLEYSLRKHASMPVDIEIMAQSHDPASFWHGWNTDEWATPFSGFRWGIPARCGYQGRAIYTDSDVIFLGDVAELWSQPIPGHAVVLAKPGSWRLCVSLWDCARARDMLWPIGDLRRDPLAHKRMSVAFRDGGVMAGFDGDWNCLDGAGHADLEDGDLEALHYTDMSCQPHLVHALPRLAAAGQEHWYDGKVRPHPRRDVQALFDRYLAEAIVDGFTPDRYVPAVPFGPYRKQSLVGYRGRA